MLYAFFIIVIHLVFLFDLLSTILTSYLNFLALISMHIIFSILKLHFTPITFYRSFLTLLKFVAFYVFLNLNFLAVFANNLTIVTESLYMILIIFFFYFKLATHIFIRTLYFLFITLFLMIFYMLFLIIFLTVNTSYRLKFALLFVKPNICLQNFQLTFLIFTFLYLFINNKIFIKIIIYFK